MKLFKVVSWLFIAFIGSVVLEAWSSYSYGLRCTKCLAGKRVAEQRLFGVTISRQTKDGDLAADYEGIFGRPCEHIFRKEGFGMGGGFLFFPSTGCGMTAEGDFFRPRNEAVSATYAVERSLHDRELTLETFRFIDTLMPPDFQIQRRRERPETAGSTLFLLGSFLRHAKTIEQWRAILSAARDDFKDTANLPTE